MHADEWIMQIEEYELLADLVKSDMTCMLGCCAELQSVWRVHADRG